jgi:hypothetical protein
VALLLCWCVTSAHAEEDSGPPQPRSPTRSHYFHVRGGAASTDRTGVPTLCLDVRVVRGFSIEACGTGAGVLHHESGSEMAHFRGTYRLRQWSSRRGEIVLRAGMGFAELQLGEDAAGFEFGQPGGDASVAGPEGSLSAQYLAPLGAGLELIASATAGVAWFAHADDLSTPQSRLQPFVSFEIGVGF